MDNMDTIGSIKDATVYISPSIKLKNYLFELENKADLPNSILQYVKRSRVTNIAEEKPTTEENESSPNGEVNLEVKNELITTNDIKWLSDYLKSVHNEDNTIYLHELFEGSEIVLPQNEIIKRNPVLEARCVRLRKDQMNRDYRAMTKNVDNVRIKHPEETISYQIKHLNKQMVAVGQFVISLGAGFLFGFLGVELMIGGLDFGFRLLLGVMCALVIALAEIYFLAKKLNEDLIINETVQLGGPTVYPNKLHSD